MAHLYFIDVLCNDIDYSVSLSSDSDSILFWFAILPLSRGSPLSSRVLPAKIILIYLLKSFAIFGCTGHKSVSSCSLVFNPRNRGSIDEIFPKRQFLFILNVGQVRRWYSLSMDNVSQ